MDKGKILKHYFDRIGDKNFELDQVRRELESADFDEADIRWVVKQVDNEIQRRLFAGSSSNYKFELTGWGVIISLIGIILIFLTRLEVIDYSYGGWINYGVLLSGLSLFFTKKVKERSKKFRN